MADKKKRKNHSYSCGFDITRSYAMTREEYYRRQKEQENKIRVKNHMISTNDIATRKLA